MTILHLHIPKVGGTSLLSILNENYTVTRLSNKGGWRKFTGIDAQVAGDCISAHMPYGLHSHFPKESCQYLTFLRDPIDRLLSFYFYVKSRKNKSVWSKELKGMTLSKWLDGDLHDNEQVRFIAGLPDIGLEKKVPITPIHFHQAQANLRTFAFTGFLDTFENDIHRASRLFNWKQPLILPHLLGSRNPGKAQLPPRLLRIAEKRTKWDMRLYEWAKKNLR